MRYATAREFVKEYAENLSKGGLFIKDAYALAPLQKVAVGIDLPGLGTFEILAEVVHIIAPSVAATLGRPAGAGLAIVESPPGFQQALETYLQRLGQRKDSLVLITDEPAGVLLGSCGYRVSRAPLPSELAATVVHASHAIIGVMVPGALVSDYRRALGSSQHGRAIPVHDIESFDHIDDMLALLDSYLMADASAPAAGR